MEMISSCAERLTRRGVLWVGLKCDLRCKFCYDSAVAPGAKIWVSHDEAKTCLNKFRYFYHNEAVDFMGGEPTLHPRILDLIGHAASIGLRPTVSTHGMHLSSPERAQQFAKAGVSDVLISIHATGDLVSVIHGRRKNNFARQLRALDNLRELGIPFRFNCTLIKDNLTHLTSVVELAVEKGATVVNFLTFNPYFEWAARPQIEFQARYREIVPYLEQAIRRCTEYGIEANVRYMPVCMLPGHEHHIYTGFQLPYDPHEWDFNSWYDMGHPGIQDAAWYLAASKRQQARHNYEHAEVCGHCAVKRICDGFHAQYLRRWSAEEARPYPGPAVEDPAHFIRHQVKAAPTAGAAGGAVVSSVGSSPLALGQFQEAAENRAGVKTLPPTI